MSLTSRCGRVIKAPTRFTYASMAEIVVGKDERKYRDPEDLECESDSDNDSVGSLVDFVASDAESLNESADLTEDDEGEFQDNETDTETDTEPECESDEDEPSKTEEDPMDLDENE